MAGRGDRLAGRLTRPVRRSPNSQCELIGPEFQNRKHKPANGSAADLEGVQSMQKPMFQTLYFEDLSVGMRETISKTVENEDVIGFAELSGDHNPIHLSEHFARKTRFGGRIVHGLYTASLISAVRSRSATSST